jgi:hypothetical protein
MERSEKLEEKNSARRRFSRDLQVRLRRPALGTGNLKRIFGQDGVLERKRTQRELKPSVTCESS